MSLIDSVSLSRAIEVQKRCYKFLQLVKDDRLNLSAGWAIGSFHSDSPNETARFKELVAANLLNFPEDSRPISAKDEDIEEFANFFISYLVCSFEIVANHEERLIQLSVSNDEGVCWCELCTRLTNAPYLKLKKVTSRDKAIANSLEFDALTKLVSTENISISKEKMNEILEDSNLIEQRALVAYGIESIRRCRGEFVDSSSLVLWRRFAWDKKKTPKKEFVLTTESIKEAEKQLISRLTTSV